jgi:hypothetical protein
MGRTRHRVSDRAHKLEKEISDAHLGGFTPEGSRGMQMIDDLIPDGHPTCHSLVALAKIFSSISGIPFHRDFTRRRALVIKWFDDNFDSLQVVRTIVTIATEPRKHDDENDKEGRSARRRKYTRKCGRRFRLAENDPPG